MIKTVAVSLDQIVTKLNSCRGLCQDFQRPQILLRQPVRIMARIQVAEVEDSAEVLTQIYKHIAEYMSAPAPFYSLKDLQTKKGRRMDQVFEGPKLLHGFIDSDELLRLQRRKILYASDLIHRLTQIDGVAVVKSLAFLASKPKSADSAVSPNQWSLQC